VVDAETVESLKSKNQAIEGKLYLNSIKRMIDEDLLHF